MHYDFGDNLDYRVGVDNLREANWAKDDGGPTELRPAPHALV
jgi:hypothetical protein